MKQSIQLALLGVAALSLSLTGCGGDQHPPYSAKVKYGIRTDPILMEPAKELGDERDDPDRPGVFPIMKLTTEIKPEHPYYSKKDKLETKLFRDPNTILPETRAELEAKLEEMFGTPAAPLINAEKAEIDKDIVKDLQIDDKTLAMGSTRYRVHCLHCHGVPGDGRGPTARWINPHPRDFRRGLFKFQSVDQVAGGGVDRYPSRADLVRTVRMGLEGTAMPSFNLLKDEEIEAIVSYVIHLSLRGQIEHILIKEFMEKSNNQLVWPKGQGNIADNIKFFTNKLVKEGWAESNTTKLKIQVAALPFDEKDMEKMAASVRRGQQFFTAKKPVPPDLLNEYRAMFYKTLFESGQEAKKAELIDVAEKKKREEAKKKNDKLTDEDLAKIKLSDDELKAIKLSAEELKSIEASATKDADQRAESKLTGVNCVSCHTDYGRQARFRFDDWGLLARPNNLVIGQLRGGKRPVDIYYRVHSGINGSGMNRFGNTLTGAEIWDIVNFVQALPYPAMRERFGIKID